MNKRKLSDASNVAVSESSTFKNKKIKTDSINYMTVPSLESIALANIVIKLWKHTDFEKEKFTGDFLKSVICNYPNKRKFNEISIIISKKVHLLPLPNVLKSDAKNVIKPIGLEIVNWIKNFENYCWLSNSIMEHFRSLCWTMKGTIHTAKTLELYLDNGNNFKKQHIFNKACEYCLEDQIANLWRQIPKDIQESRFYSKNIYQKYYYHIVAYWICCVRNELPKLLSMIRIYDFNNMYNSNDSIYKNMFRLSLFGDKVLAVKYFWNKLTDEERNNRVSWACLVLHSQKHNPHHKKNADIMCFLLSQMNDKEQKEVFQKYSDVILNCLFFCWPWQSFLLPTVQLMWNYLDSKGYVKLLSDAIFQIHENKSTGFLVKDLWCNSPMKFKKHFIQHIIEAKNSDLLHLFEIGEIQTALLIFNDANVKEKKQIIFSAISTKKLLNLMWADKFFLIEMLIKESLMEECEIKNVKKNILLKYGDALCCYCVYNDNWQAAKKILDWGLNSEDQFITFKAKILNRIKVDNSLGILGTGKWSSFVSFLNCFFNSAEEIKQFKLNILAHDKMGSFISDIIIRGYNFEFANKLLVWYFPSEIEIHQFKKELMLSDVGIDMFHRVLSDYGYINENYGHWHLIEFKMEEKRLKYGRWELVEKLTEWFHPFEKEVLIEFKEKFRKNSLKYQGFCNRFKKDGLIRFFFLLDRFMHGFNDNRDIIIVLDKILDYVNDLPKIMKITPRTNRNVSRNLFQR